MIKNLLLITLLTVFLLSPTFAAFPTIAGEITTVEASNATTHAINYPTSIATDNLLVACVGMDGSAEVITWPGGWTDIITHAAGATSASCKYMVAAGTETGTFNVTTTNSETACAMVWRINDYELPATQAPEGNSASGGSVNPNPPSLTPTGGAADFMWIGFVAHDQSDTTVSVWSTSYTDTEQINAGANICLQERRENNTATEDPSALTISGSRSWKGLTVAIHPGAEGETAGSTSQLLLLSGPD